MPTKKPEGITLWDFDFDNLTQVPITYPPRLFQKFLDLLYRSERWRDEPDIVSREFAKVRKNLFEYRAEVMKERIIAAHRAEALDKLVDAIIQEAA